MYIVSACLAGARCRYDGDSNEVKKVRELVESGKAIALCPEVLGGLATPRIPCEIQRKDDHLVVINKEGEDVTEQFVKGAKIVAEVAKLVEAEGAILKARSPSCGCGQIYDGSFSKVLIEGNGLAAQELINLGIPVVDETEFIEKNA